MAHQGECRPHQRQLQRKGGIGRESVCSPTIFSLSQKHSDADNHFSYERPVGRRLVDYVGELVTKRMQEPQDDLISSLAIGQVKPGHIDQGEAVQIVFLLLVAGNATLVNMIALVCFLSVVHSSLYHSRKLFLNPEFWISKRPDAFTRGGLSYTEDANMSVV
jgi:hypothetical protein